MFVASEKISLNRKNAPCTADPLYSLTGCIFQYIATSVGCQADWLGLTWTTNLPKCLIKEEILKYDAVMNMIGGMSWADLTHMTGCQARCHIRQFSFTECKDSLVTWKHDWSSAFYLAPETTEVIISEELWVFDIFDTINGIGGAMGLFLGWSVLFLLQKCVSSGKNICLQIYNYLNN